MKKIGLLFCVLLIFIVPACGLLLEKGREVVAEVAGEPIRARDLQAEIRSLPFDQRAEANDTDPEVRFETRSRVLREMVTERIMVLEAEAVGLEVTEEEILEILAGLEQGQDAEPDEAQDLGGAATGRSHEHDEGAHSEREMEEVRRFLLIEKLKAGELSDEAARRRYDEHIDEYMMESPVLSLAIIVADASDSQVIDSLHKLATEKGITLFDAYKAMGEPKEIISAGMMPPMPIDQIVPSIREAVEPLRSGQISKPFYYQEKDENRYGVARLLKRFKKTPFPIVKEKLKIELEMALISRLEEKYEVAYHNDELNYRVGD